MPKMKYGWVPDIPDFRDHMYQVGFWSDKELPPKVDLRPHDIPLFNQGSLSSCTGNAISAHIGLLHRKEQKPEFIPSRLFIYYNERVMMNAVNQDGGAYLRDGIKSIAKQGVCPESMWPYENDRFAVKPSDECYAEALNHQGLSYRRLNVDLKQMKECLSEGFPFVFGFAVYESFEGAAIAQSGKLSMPSKNEKQFGGHAVLGVGYDDELNAVIVRNSWGPEWGDKGYFYMPYEYISNNNLCDDFWTIREFEM